LFSVQHSYVSIYKQTKKNTQDGVTHFECIDSITSLIEGVHQMHGGNGWETLPSQNAKVPI